MESVGEVYGHSVKKIENKKKNEECRAGVGSELSLGSGT